METRILKTWFKVAVATLTVISLVGCGPSEFGSESSRATKALEDAGRAVFLKSGVSGMSQPQVVGRTRAAHASAVVWGTSGGGQRCFYLEALIVGSGPQGTSSCGTDSASECTMDRLGGFILGIVPRPWTGALAISTGEAPIQTVAVNKGYFLIADTNLLPKVLLTLSFSSNANNSGSCTATLR